jgi:enoyl-CoA hydratase
MEAPSRSHGDLLIEPLEGGVARVVISRPQSLNAISRQLREDLIQVLDELDRDPQVSAIVLTGAGGRAFAAGQDLTEAQSSGART